MKFCLTLAATVLLGAVSLEAHAQQPWLSDRQYGEGMGVRVGDLELHPGIAAEAGYDSNYFLRSGAANEPIISTYRLRATPSISLSTLGPQRREGGGPPVQSVIFRGGAYVSVSKLIAADSKYSSEVSDQPLPLDVGADLALTLFPQAQIGPDAYLNFIRSVQPSNDTDTENAFNRDGLRFGAGLTWRPGGGLFQWRAGYEGLYNYFEKSAFRYLNNFQNQVNVRGNWRFLPRTALLYDGSYTWINYANNSTTERDGAIVRSRIGLNGLITNRWSLLAMVGWAGTFYNAKAGEPPQQFDSLTGQLELKWFISGGGPETMSPSSAPVGLSYASLGYTRDVSNSYLGNFYQKDRGYVGISYLLGGVFVTSLTVGVANLKFPESFFTSGAQQQPSFSEQRVDANLFAEYRLNNSFGLNGTLNYDQNITGVAIKSSEDDTTPRDELKFSRWQVFLGARYFL
jgi:hypothetical protein